MKFLSLCSGIEAASVAFEPLGFEAVAFSEIEPFPSAVLAHHWPHVPNLGDMTKWEEWRHLLHLPDLLVGGTPCQAFSVAGLRNSLTDGRGQLSLTFIQIFNAIDESRKNDGRPPAICLWENVPGVLTTKDNAFGCFLGGLAGEDLPLEPPGGRWTDAGLVHGPQRGIAWRVLDAQFFGLAQRRRRVFVVASAREGFDPSKVLFEREGLQRNSPPSREAGKGASSGIEGRSHWSGGPHPSLNQSHNTGGIGMSNQEIFSQEGAGLVPDLTRPITAGIGKGPRGTEGIESNWMIPEVANCLQTTCDDYSRADGFNMIAHALRAEHDASEDGTGRGTPLVAVGFSCKDHGGDAIEEASPTLRSMGHNASHANGGGQVAVDYGFNGDQSEKTRSMGEKEEQAPTLRADGPSHVAFGVNESPDLAHCLRSGASKADKPESTTYVAASAVRRLTPTECERLQGFPDNHTLIPWKKKPADQCPDGPRYKALGNSMAVPVMRWIGSRIKSAVEAMERGKA